MGECKCGKTVTCKKPIKIIGAKWELPVPKSTEYWREFCKNEEQNLIVVRNPLHPLSLSPDFTIDSELPNFNTNSIDDTFNFDSLFVSKADRDETFENSLQGLSRIETVSFPEPVLKAPFRARTKIPDTTGSPSKVVRIPKLDTQGAQPSSARIFPVKVDRIRASFAVQNEPKAAGKGTSVDFAALTNLAGLRTTSGAQSTLNKLPGRLRSPKRSNFSEKLAASAEDRRGNKKAEGLRHTKSRDGEKDQKRQSDRVSLKCSIRLAYKALKHLTCNKKLDFRPKIMEQSREQRLPMLDEDKYMDEDEKQDPLEPEDTEEESLRVEDAKRMSLKDSEFTGTDVEAATLKSDQATSKTIPSESRCTSAPSLEFARPESGKSSSSRVLRSIPRLSGYPRKNRDRCLPCLYRPFEAPVKPKVSFPRTVLRRILTSKKVKIAPSGDSSEDSDSTLLDVENFANESRKILNPEAERNDVTFVEHKAAESRVEAEDVSSVQEKHQTTEETTEEKSTTDLGISCKTISRKGTVDPGDDDLTSKNLNDPGTKLSTSFHSESSDEDDSIVISINNEQAKPKYLVPCHAPTVFRPSLEPLRALRHRKATTLKDRIALLESSSLKKNVPVDDPDDVPEESKSVSKSIQEEGRPSLTKSMSVLERLAPLETPLENKHVLKKGTSLTNIPTSEFMLDKPNLLRDTSEDVLKKLNVTAADNFSKSDSKPLTPSNQIAEVLTSVIGCSSSTIMEILCKEFSECLSKISEKEDPRLEKKIVKLARMIIDFKRYLYPDKLPSDLLFPSNQPICCNKRLLRKVLPRGTYNLIAPILRLPEQYQYKPTYVAYANRVYYVDEYCYTGDSLSGDESGASLYVYPPSLVDVETLSKKKKVGQRRYNPYALFLTKPRRKVVTWRPLTEEDMEGYDPDATLKMRTKRVMDKIFHEFCQWIESLSGTDNTVDEEVLKDMFQIDFDAEACKAIQAVIEEMPVVPSPVAITRNSPGASKLAMTRKHVMKDVAAEKRPAKTIAFGTGIPHKLRFVPPNNQVMKRWVICDKVPADLDSMDAIWKDITHMLSVKRFIMWLKQHPKVPPPKVLKELVAMDENALRRHGEDQLNFELDVNEIADH